MPTFNSPLPEIDDADLKAAREFLNINVNSSPRDDRGNGRRKPTELTSRSASVTVHHGITRARGRLSAGKTGA